jgi:hypothetical protein
MAKFLVTSGVSHHLEQIITNAQEKLYLVSPYLKLNDRIKALLSNRSIITTDIRIIYGKNDLLPDENNWLTSLSYIKTSFCKNLHAKCYMNENEALITSMNLYESSQVNNNEMGILVGKTEEPELYEAVLKEVRTLLTNSDSLRVTVEKITTKEMQGKGSPHKSIITAKGNSIPETGFCIRCKNPLILDPKHPFCKECYAIWKQHGNPDYQEKYCHICGKPNKSFLSKPSCYTCYNKYKSSLDFPAKQ